MTARQLIDIAGEDPLLLLAIFAAPPVAALILRALHGREGGKRPPWTYGYSLLVYATCIPGMLAAVLTAYALFFTRQNLLDVNLLVYGLPLISMVITLLAVSRAVVFTEIPGFGRLSGLMVMLAVAFGLTLALARTRIWLFFGGSITTLVLFVAALFGLLKWGAYMAFRRRGEPERPRPGFPLK